MKDKMFFPKEFLDITLTRDTKQTSRHSDMIFIVQNEMASIISF